MMAPQCHRLPPVLKAGLFHLPPPSTSALETLAPESSAETQPVEESQFYTIQRGDTLSGIAKKFYGKANEYMYIFEENRGVIDDPDKIYPGQTIRIPPLQ